MHPEDDTPRPPATSPAPADLNLATPEPTDPDGAATNLAAPDPPAAHLTGPSPAAPLAAVLPATGPITAALREPSAPVRAASRTSEPVPSVLVHRPGTKRHVSRASLAAISEDPEDSVPASERPGQMPWSRLLLALTIAGPALWLGGVPVSAVPAFLAVVLLLWLRLCSRGSSLRIPYGTAIGGCAALITFLQWVPLPHALRAWLAPDLLAMSEAALAGSGVSPWPGLSPVPGDSALEVARLLGLTALYVAAAQLSWRVSAAFVAGTGAIVALLGLVQAGLGVREIYGFYQPSDVDPALTPALLTSFVNPNHQAGLFLLGIFCAGALAVHYRLQAQDTGDPNRLARARERALVALGAVAIQGVAVLLSLSRGAMAALLLVAPIGLMLAWARDGEARGRLWLRRVLVFAGFAGAAVMLARQSGAWAELATLARTGEPGFETKFRVAQDAVHLVPLSPVLGVGRGAFIDLFPAIDTQPAGVLHTHLESAPMAMLVEWGPVAGLAITLGLLWWWIAAMYSSSGRAGRARRIALCGPLALAIHSLGDFSLEFLGVAAPLCALAGALSERRMISRWSARSGLLLGGGILVGALALSLWALPHTWQRRERSEVATRSDAARPAPATDLSPETALRMRPLDAGLHTRLAFQAIAREDWAEARARALVATRLHPNAADPWWLLTAAEDGLGDADASAVALARTLAVVRKPLSPEVVDTLLRRYPGAEELATRMPDALAPWTVVMESIIPVAPSYAAILAATRTQVDRQEPEVLRLQVRIAFATHNPALARHHALLLRQLAPAAASSHLLLIQALRSFPVPRERELQAAAELALTDLALGSPGERGLIEEELVASLLRTGSPDDRARARELLPTLLARPGDRAALQRRNTLREAAAD